jgi:hypothetical protein
MEARRMEPSGGVEAKAIRRGWCLGSAHFKTGLLDRMEGKLGKHHAGELKREGAEAKGERIIREELRRLRWTENDLTERPKSDPAKLAMAARLRRETTLTLPWVAARRRLGSWKSANAKLRRWKLSRDRRLPGPDSGLNQLQKTRT